MIIRLVRSNSFVLLNYHDLFFNFRTLDSDCFLPSVKSAVRVVERWRINMFQCQTLVNKIFIGCEASLLHQVLIFDITYYKGENKPGFFTVMIINNHNICLKVIFQKLYISYILLRSMRSGVLANLAVCNDFDLLLTYFISLYIITDICFTLTITLIDLNNNLITDYK